MLRSGNTTTILCEEQTKFILDRIGAVEKHFSELCGAFSEYTRKVARLRDKSDELAHATQDYCDAEKYNRTLANALSSLAKAVTLIGDFQDTKVKRLETKIVAELSQYESVCKHCKEGMKDALLVRDKDLARRKQLEQSKNRNGRFKRNTNDTEIIKSNLEVEKSLKEIEQIVERFEKQKLHDIKDLLRSFVLTELKMHTQAMEVLSATYQDINEIDECKDHQQFKKYLQQDAVPDRYFLQRIKSQSMGALNATFAGFAGGRKNKSLSSNSLNSSQEQEQEQDSLPVVEQQRSQRHPASRRSNKTSVQQSVESLDSLKHDISTESKTSTEDEDSEDSETLTDENSELPVKQTRPAIGGETAKKSQTWERFVSILCTDARALNQTDPSNTKIPQETDSRSLATGAVESKRSLLDAPRNILTTHSVTLLAQSVWYILARCLWPDEFMSHPTCRPNIITSEPFPSRIH
uniref:BAR domain-containing protein n=1 Tax=Anopheles atroparvus TaxID=41427 RepID=A0AAG5DE42_ANOAO